MRGSHLSAQTSRSLDTAGELLQSFAPLSLLLGALLLWFASLGDVADLRQMTDLGLISVLPLAFFVSIGLASASFALSLYKGQPVAVLIAHVVVLVFMLFGVAPLLEGTPRTSIAWKLVGIMDYVARRGAVDPSLDAFHNWPGFFILLAFLTKALGLPNALPLALWAPIFFNLFYLGPLYLLFKTASGDTRVKWLAIWLFYLANWIGQDYLSPQAFGYAIYLLTLAVLLRWFRVPRSAAPARNWQRLPPRLANVAIRLERWLDDYPRSPAPSTPRQRLLLIGIIIFLFAILVPSHQLSPVAILASTTVLVALQRITPRSLPILMLVLIGVWLSYMTVPYLSGHLEGLVDPLGDFGANLQDNVSSRVRGSPEHIFVVRLRIVMTALLWGLALLGFLRRRHNRYRDVDFALLAATPFGLLGLQTYGGELLLRVYLFSLPFMAFFVATLFYPTAAAGKSWRTPLFIGLLCAVFIPAFFAARYGNERMDYFTAAEIEGVELLYETAPPDSLLASVTDFLPWRHRDYEVYDYTKVERQLRDANLDDVDNIMRSGEDSYLILTRSQKASTDLFWGWDEGQWDDTVRLLATSENYEVIYDTPDVSIFRFVGTRAATTEGD